MAQLWGGRFTKETDKLVYNFNASINFDKKFYKQDMEGSIAHVKMLAAVGILTDEERDKIIAGIEGILRDVENGSLEITEEYEDIHSFVEANLIDRIGDAGKKLHTGRSRNDQVALDMKLYIRDEVQETDTLIKEMLEAILGIMENNLETYMPGFTHLQKALIVAGMMSILYCGLSVRKVSIGMSSVEATCPRWSRRVTRIVSVASGMGGFSLWIPCCWW